MARRTQLALQRQLKRERAHLRWLEQHLPQSMQLFLSKERIAKLAAQSAILSDSKQKKALHQQRFFLSHASNCRCSVHHYIFCEVGSGVTIVFTGSVVGAEHAATVRARTKPTTTFFIVYPFISLRLNIALRKRAAPSSAAQYIMR
jgi:exonuclease VII large subunit